MRIFVVGKLGELIKKVIELTDIIEEHPEDVSLLVAELASYQSVLEMWPVPEGAPLGRAIDVFKLNIHKLKVSEKELRLTKANDPFLGMILAHYWRYLDAVREDLKNINELGMYIGPSSYLEVVDADVEQPKDQNSSSFGNDKEGTESIGQDMVANNAI